MSSIRKQISFLAAIAFLVASCGDDSSAPAGIPTTSTSAPSTTVASPPPEDRQPLDIEPTPWPGNVVAATTASNEAWIETEAEVDGLTIEAMEPEGEPVASAEFGGAEAFAAFELGPDGSVFEQDVVVSTIVPTAHLSDDGIPAISAAVSHGGGPYEPVDVTMSQDGEHLVARAEVDEFSIIRFAVHGARRLRLSGDHAVPLSMFWASGSKKFEITATVAGEEVGAGSGIESIVLARDSAALDWQLVPDGSLDLIARCIEPGEGSYAVGIHLGGGTVMVTSGPGGPFAPIDCKRLIAPLDPPPGFSIVYATCDGRFEELTNLDPNALAEAATALGVAFEHRRYTEAECDSHNAGPSAELGGLRADLYLTHLGFEALIRGDRGGEEGRDGEFYPEPPSDLSSIFVPIAAGAPDWVGSRQLTSFETWLVLHGAIRDRLDPDITDSGSIDWGNHPVLGADPIDVEGFEAAFQQQWNTPLE